MASSSSARQVSSWIYEKKVFVCAPTFDVGRLAQVRVCHDRKLGQGYVSINMRLSLADMDENQVIKLRICPEMVYMCSVKSTCDVSIPDQVVSMLHGVKEARRYLHSSFIPMHLVFFSFHQACRLYVQLK
jgi:hypothetical protein